MRGALHCALDGEAVQCFGRDTILGEIEEGNREGKSKIQGFFPFDFAQGQNDELKLL